MRKITIFLLIGLAKSLNAMEAPCEKNHGKKKTETTHNRFLPYSKFQKFNPENFAQSIETMDIFEAIDEAIANLTKIKPYTSLDDKKELFLNVKAEYKRILKGKYAPEYLNLDIDKLNQAFKETLLEIEDLRDKIREQLPPGEKFLASKFMIETYNKNEEKIAKLIVAGANTNLHPDRNFSEPLLTCLINDEIETNLFPLLFFYGVDVNSYDAYGNPALICAILKRNVKIAKLLIKHNADINMLAKTSQGTALSSAVYYGILPIVKMLLNNPKLENICEEDNFDNTALDYAIKQFVENPHKKKYIKILKGLVKAGTPLGTNKTDKEHKKAIKEYLSSIDSDYLNILKKLLLEIEQIKGNFEIKQIIENY